jgi:[NiFe] hydrogenase diaphorase moiety large subunit
MTIRSDMTLATIEAGAGLRAALGMDRAGVIGVVRESGMKGRGGAGFPTGVKWNLAAAAGGDRKYAICNADEGEPGTFKDRVILTEWPDLVFEGMTIAGYAIGATTGIVYLRGEYSYLLHRLEQCLEARRAAGLLGENVGGKRGFTFDIVFRMGAGAYVCGEETALIESLEGHRGEARNRPPFPVNTGFQGAPTIVNNVETFAWAAATLARGAEWFRGIGTERSTGPKMLSISGDVERPGVYEFPMGTSIQAILEAAGGADAKAVVVGGASGHCVPASEFSRGISFEDAATGGAIIVFGPERDMLDAAENFLEFFVEESCGQCTPCRIGNVQLLRGVRALRDGELSTRDLEELRGLGASMQLASKCGLGQSSPNAFLSIVKHFRNEVLGRTCGTANGVRRAT